MHKQRGILARVAAAFATLVLALGIAVPAQAATTGTLTVGGDVEATATTTVYKVIDANYANDGSFTGYTWNAKVKTWVGAYDGGKYADIQAFSKLATDSTEVKAFYDSLASAVKGGSLKLDAAATITGKGSAQNLAGGSYLMVTIGNAYVYRSVGFNMDEKGVVSDKTIDVKSSKPEIKKDTKDTPLIGLQIGDTVGFRLTVDVPVYPSNAVAKNLWVSDALPKGITLNANSIKVYGDVSDTKADTLTAGNQYTLEVGTADKPVTNHVGDKVSFIVKFDADKVAKYKSVRVEYTGVINNKIDITVDGNTNTAKLEYNNNPFDGNSWKTDTKPGEEKVYSFGLDVTKVDAANQDKTLTGVQFELYRGAAATGNAIAVTGTAGSYTVAEAGATGTTTTLEADANGKIAVNGLGTGDYTLKETEAPEGYNGKGKTFKVTLADANNDGKLDNGENGANNGTNRLAYKVPNTQGFELPTTGGMGTVLFTAAGVVLVGGGVALLARRGRAER